ncbi:MAG: SPOR domain-containing protein [Marinobacter sp.]|nr:SPOR domain-containing protein [Marinobacter sp.]
MDGLKQRLIGALVLISLAVIFVPMLFDEPHPERTSRVIDIPDEPVFPAVQVRSPTQQQLPDTVESAPGWRIEEPEAAPVTPPAEPAVAQPRPQPQVPAAAPAPQPEQVQYAETLQGAWVVQLGSFGSADNARGLRDRVREAGYNAHVQRVERAGAAPLQRVFAGPFIERSDADKAKQALDRQFSVNSLVTSGDR